MKRREFLAGAGALAAAGFGGCRGCGKKEGAWKGAAAPTTPNYWCTWGTQAFTIEQSLSAGTISFEGDQGMPKAADNLTEETVFGAKGWARTHWEKSRKNLFLTFDHGWDVPYFCDTVKGLNKFGSQILDRERFPSFKGTDVERLGELCKRVADLGWRGTGIWVSPQAPGETHENKFEFAKLKETMKRQLEASRKAGVGFWKVDWGSHQHDLAYRKEMSALKEQIHPGLIIEHCVNGGPVNGLWIDRKTGEMSGSRRLYGEKRAEYRLQEALDFIAFSDVFRIYDLLVHLDTATAFERMAYYLEGADRLGSKCIMGAEDQIYMAAALGGAFGVMRSPVWGAPEKGKISERERNARRMYRSTEVDRAVNWQQIAPAFGGDLGIKTVHSEKTMTDSWTYEQADTWYGPSWGKTFEQHAPAAVVRGLALPEVTAGADGDVPWVAAARYPNGAMSVGALPRTQPGKAYKFPRADVEIDWELTAAAPAGVFGRYNSLTVKNSGAGRVYARDLAGGEDRDITELVERRDGKLRVDGAIVDRIGTEAGAAGDESWPGMLLWVS